MRSGYVSRKIIIRDRFLDLVLIGILLVWLLYRTFLFRLERISFFLFYCVSNSKFSGVIEVGRFKDLVKSLE